MSVNKKFIFVILFLLLSLPIVIYFVNYRWGGGDAGSYILGLETFLASFYLDSYSVSGALFSPLLILAGGHPDSLIYSSILYRVGFSLALPQPKARLLAITLISFLFFPLHTLLSLFPGKDVFSYGFFILLVYSILQGDLGFRLFLFSALSFVFRPPLGFFLFMASLSYYLCFLFSSRVRLSRSILLALSALFVLASSTLFLSFLSDFALADVQERVSAELDAGHFNVTGYTAFPLSVLNLFYPLFSLNPISFYSFLSLENIVSLFLIFSFLKRPAPSSPRYLAFKLLCIFVVLYAFFFSSFWPNVTDASRKVYPLTFCGATSFFLLRDRRELQG